MTRRDQTASIAFSLGLVAALLSLCLRLMAPAGWMPVVSAGSVVFTLCGGDGARELVVGKHGIPIAPEDGAAHGPCAFAGLGTPHLPDVPPAVAVQLCLLLVAAGLAATPRLRLAAASWLRPPLRGPPITI